MKIKVKFIQTCVWCEKEVKFGSSKVYCCKACEKAANAQMAKGAK